MAAAGTDNISFSVPVTVRYQNYSRYLIGDSLDNIQLKIVNKTLYLVGEPALKPTIAFAHFRENPLYVKVWRW